MNMHVNVVRALGVAAALTLGVSSIVAAQSDRRVPVSKEAPRETPAPTMETRVDTVTMWRRDTVMVAGPARVEYRTDTLWRTPEMPMMRPVGGLFFSLGGGAAIPNQLMENGYETGFNAMAVLGYQPVNNPLGLQVDASYNRFDRDGSTPINPTFAGSDAEPQMWTGSALGRLSLPVFQTLRSRGIQIYGLGGVTYHVFKGFDQRTGLNTEPANQGGDGNDPDEWSDDFGFAAGAGLTIRLGRAELFGELRRNWISAANYQTGYVPVTVGLTWR